MSITEKEREQFGAVSFEVPEEEWIKPKTDKVILYFLKKRLFQKCILWCMTLFVIMIIFSVLVLQFRTLSIEELSGAKSDIGKYIKGDILFRTKIEETDFGVTNGGDKKWKYLMGIPYGEQKRYVILLIEENSYEKYEALPEINFQQQNIHEEDSGYSVKIEGKVRNLTELPWNLEYWCNLFDITDEMCQDENGMYLPEKQEELLGKKLSMVVYIEPEDIMYDKGKILLIESGCFFIIMGIILWKRRFYFFDKVEKK